MNAGNTITITGITEKMVVNICSNETPVNIETIVTPNKTAILCLTIPFTVYLELNYNTYRIGRIRSTDCKNLIRTSRKPIVAISPSVATIGTVTLSGSNFNL